ncbi:MAG: hypothetical protein AAB545_01830 [Patescibacteria group bacterium]
MGRDIFERWVGYPTILLIFVGVVLLVCGLYSFNPSDETQFLAFIDAGIRTLLFTASFLFLVELYEILILLRLLRQKRKVFRGSSLQTH